MLDFLEILEHFCTKILSIHICHKVWKKMLEDATVKFIFSWMQRWDFYENTRRRDDCRGVPHIGHSLFPFLQFSLHFNVPFWNTVPKCWPLWAVNLSVCLCRFAETLRRPDYSKGECLCIQMRSLLAVLVVPVNIHESQTFEKVHILLVVTSM